MPGTDSSSLRKVRKTHSNLKGGNLLGKLLRNGVVANAPYSGLKIIMLTTELIFFFFRLSDEL